MTNKLVLLTVKEVSELLRVQRAKVYILIETGALKATKIGSDWRIRLDSVEEVIGPLPLEYITRCSPGTPN